MHAHDRIKFIITHAEDRFVAAKACIIDHDIEVAVSIERRLQQVVCVVAVGTIT